MKTNILTMLLCTATVLASCSKDDSGTAFLPDTTPSAIVPTAGMNISAAPSGRAALPEGPIEGTTFPKGTENVFAVTAYKGTAAPSGDYSNAYFSNAAVNSDADGKLGFATAQYYPADAQKLYFYAYSPVSTTGYTQGTNTAAPTTAWTLTGKEDLMYASVTEGIAKAGAGGQQSQPNFTFQHLLKQVRFKLVKGTGFGDNISADRISITNCKTAASLNLITGKLDFSGEASTLSLPRTTGTTYPIAETATEIDDCILCEPGADLVIEVEAQGITYKTNVTLKSSDTGVTAGGAGVSHLVTLTFIGTLIKPDATIVDWVDAGETSGEIK